MCVCACKSNALLHLKEKVLELHHALQQGAASAALDWRDGCGRESSSSNLWQYCPRRGATVRLFRSSCFSSYIKWHARCKAIHKQIYGYILSRYLSTIYSIYKCRLRDPRLSQILEEGTCDNLGILPWGLQWISGVQPLNAHPMDERCFQFGDTVGSSVLHSRVWLNWILQACSCRLLDSQRWCQVTTL